MQVALSVEPYTVRRYHHREFTPEQGKGRDEWNFPNDDHFEDPIAWLADMEANPEETLNRINEKIMNLRHDERKGGNYLGYYNDW